MMRDRRVVLFLPEAIRLVVAPNRSGTYALGDMEGGEFRVRYVGRSDRCLQTRLLTHERLYQFSYFYFQYTATCREAFHLESKWWHCCIDFDIPLQNQIHPDSPTHMAMSCPYCQFARTVKQSLGPHMTTITSGLVTSSA